MWCHILPVSVKDHFHVSIQWFIFLSDGSFNCVLLLFLDFCLIKTTFYSASFFHAETTDALTIPTDSDSLLEKPTPPIQPSLFRLWPGPQVRPLWPLSPPLPQGLLNSSLSSPVCSHTPRLSFFSGHDWVNVKLFYRVPTLHIPVSLTPALFGDLPLGPVTLLQAPCPSLSHGAPCPILTFLPSVSPVLSYSPPSCLSVSGCSHDRLLARLIRMAHLPSSRAVVLKL